MPRAEPAAPRQDVRPADPGGATRRPGRSSCPAVVIIIGLAIVPIGWSLLLSFNSADLIAPAQWVGLSNYEALLDDPALRDAITHTVIYTVLFVPISIALGLFLAIGLNRKMRLIGLYRTAILAPFIASVAAQGVLFSFIFDERFGVANALLDDGRTAAPGLSRRPRPGAVRDRPDRDLGRDRLPARDLPRGAPGRPPRADRRGLGRRRTPLGDAPARDPAAAAAGDDLPRSSGRRCSRCSSSTSSTRPPAADRSTRRW